MIFLAPLGMGRIVDELEEEQLAMEQMQVMSAEQIEQMEKRR